MGFDYLQNTSIHLGKFSSEVSLVFCGLQTDISVLWSFICYENPFFFFFLALQKKNKAEFIHVNIKPIFLYLCFLALFVAGRVLKSHCQICLPLLHYCRHLVGWLVWEGSQLAWTGRDTDMHTHACVHIQYSKKMFRQSSCRRCFFLWWPLWDSLRRSCICARHLC